ncbi:MAG: alpha-L-fucosidase [Bacteroidota bacterium]
MNRSKMMRIAKLGGVVLVSLLGTTCTQKQEKNEEQKEFEGTVSSLMEYRAPEWFRDAKFGIYLHWGVYSVPEMNEWYPRRMYQQGSGAYEHHVETYGHPSEFGYKDFIPMWKAENFDPDQLVSLFKRAGAKYFTPCAVHHDNFDLWDSKYQPWNSVNMGPKKDLMKLWRAAALKQGLRFGVTTHVARSYSWLNVANQSDREGPMAGVPYDGDNPEYDGLYFTKHDDTSSRGPESPPESWKEEWAKRMKDLIDNYHPDHFYFDGAIPFNEEYGKTGMDVVAHLLNHSMEVHGGKQEAVMCYKERPFNGIFVDGMLTLDYERGKSPEIRKKPWQTDDTIGPWGYKKGAKYKSVNTVVDKLLDIVSKNGNLLLNIPIKADGTLDQESVQFLENMGQWMAINGEGIYGTRPWYRFGEGKVNEIPEMGRTSIFTHNDIRYTTKEDVLYAFVMDWPGAGETVWMKQVSHNNHSAGKVRSVTLLGVGEVAWKQDRVGLYVTMPHTKPHDYAYGLKIEFESN